MSRPITTDERAIIDLMRSYAVSILSDGEHIWLDPEPGWAGGEQYHFWYHCSGANRGTMAGWFNVDNKIVKVTTFTNLSWVTKQYDPEADKRKLVHLKLNVSNPNVDELKKILRREFDKARKFLLREAKSGKR